MTAEYEEKSPIFFLLIIFALICFGFYWVINNGEVINGSHAVEKHGEEIVSVVRNCNGGIELFNPDTNRIACIVNLGDKKFGVRIIEKVGDSYKEVTAFIKDKMHSVEQVIKYLNNRGYYQ